jgi:hypothetical protein
LTVYGQHHPRAGIDRLYVPRKEGRWLTDRGGQCKRNYKTGVIYRRVWRRCCKLLDTPAQCKCFAVMQRTRVRRTYLLTYVGTFHMCHYQAMNTQLVSLETKQWKLL